MNKQQLIEKHETNKISKAQLGQLRRIVLEELLEDITKMDSHHVAEWLDKKRSKLAPAKLANAVGYGTTTDTLRQSLKAVVKAAEYSLKHSGLITSEAKSNVEIHQDNEEGVLAFLAERLNNASYEWPVNNRNKLYHRVLWSFYIDMPVDEVKSSPTFFSRNTIVKGKLAEIDVLIAHGKLKTLNYESLSALDDMEKTMTSAAISKLRQQVNETKSKLAVSEEKLKKCEEDNKELLDNVDLLNRKLTLYKNRDEALVGNDLITDIKMSGAH